MGVYIDMEMPTSCYKCPMRRRHGMDLVCPIVHERFSIADINILEYRLDNCPLVPVPPHGDLVDRAEIREIAVSLLDKAVTDQEANAIREMWSHLRQMPVFIPAEEG